MDFISHGLWGGLAFGRRNRRDFFLAVLFGITPDVLSFGIFSFMRIVGLASGIDWSNGPPSEHLIPQYVHLLYNFTHSLVTAAAAFLIVYIVRRKIIWPMLAWPLHILMDIPTHSTRFFATPFLWPISNYRFDGISWGRPYILLPDIAILAILYTIYFIWNRSTRKP
ncbi:MAG: hypothetical protein V2A66_05010 [Pseudomonadota bacterium]